MTSFRLRVKPTCPGHPKRRAFGWPFSSIGKDFNFFGKGPGFESRDSLFLFLKFVLGVLGHWHSVR
jgi:hypothetical protein